MSMSLRPAESHYPGQKPAISRITLFNSLDAAEPVWRQLETAADSVMSPYQRFDFLAPWQRHVGSRRGLLPLIAVGFDGSDNPVCLWPLGLNTTAGTRTARFLGGKHANFNGMIWRRDLAEAATPDLFIPIFETLATVADALILINQPSQWDGLRNPLTLLPHSMSADPAYSGRLQPDYQALLHRRLDGLKRKKLRNRERALASYGAVTFRRAESTDDARNILKTFHQQKAQRMRELGVRNVFAAPGVAEFIAEAACANFEDGATVEVYALTAGNEIVATCAGVTRRGHFSNMFNSITRTEMDRAGPGQLLLTRLIQTLCERGITTFDQGVGQEPYKELFCNEPEPLFDSFLPLTTAGRMIAGATRAAYAAKRTVKQTPALWSSVQMARRLRGRLG
jgi:CelD/BcsL family acetyltransferase involved in cellulose biosynthesis